MGVAPNDPCGKSAGQRHQAGVLNIRSTRLAMATAMAMAMAMAMREVVPRSKGPACRGVANRTAEEQPTVSLSGSPADATVAIPLRPARVAAAVVEPTNSLVRKSNIAKLKISMGPQLP